MALPRSVGKSNWFRSVRRRYWNAVRPFLRFRTWIRRLRKNGMASARSWFLRRGYGSRAVAREEPERMVKLVTVRKLIELVESMATERRQKRAHAVYVSIIKNILGEEWFDRHVMAAVHDRTVRAGFVGYKIVGDGIAEPSVQRIHHLAEMILNLQCVPGFHDRMEQMRTLSSEGIEGAYAELEAATILYWHGLNFRFVEKVRNPKRGLDYDLEVARNGQPIAIDAKCKVEATEPSQSSLWNSLKEAKDQIPSDGPGAIIVKIPEHWFIDGKKLASEIVDVTGEFFRSTGRVVSVIYYTPFRDFSGTQAVVDHRYRELENLNCRYRHVARNLLAEFEPMKDWPSGEPRWIILDRIITGKPSPGDEGRNI